MESRAMNAVLSYGHVICCEKWRNSALVQHLREGGMQILFDSELGTADFYLPERNSVLYLSECDVISSNGYKKKLLRYRNASSSFLQLVFVEKTRLCDQYFPAVQKLVVLDLGLSLLIVSGQTEAAQLIAQMVRPEGPNNPFRRKDSCQVWDPSVLALIQQIPGVGRVKALTLLHTFHSIREICHATPAELEPVVGQVCAQQIHSFLHNHTATGSGGTGPTGPVVYLSDSCQAEDSEVFLLQQMSQGCRR